LIDIYWFITFYTLFYPINGRPDTYCYISDDNPWIGGAVLINDGAECTSTQNITLTMDKGSNTDADQMRISEDPFFGGAVWEPYAATKPWVLSVGYGTKTVYVQFRVGASGPLSNVFNDQIEYAETCITEGELYTVGGTVSGLTGTGLALQNNGAEILSIAADGSFTFLTELVDTTAYTVIVSTQPTGQTCTVTNGSGAIAAADVTNVSVACVDDAVTPPPAPMVPVPTLSQWALILLTMLLGLMVFANRRRLF
jgi:hypothetical protein